MTGFALLSNVRMLQLAAIRYTKNWKKGYAAAIISSKVKIPVVRNKLNLVYSFLSTHGSRGDHAIRGYCEEGHALVVVSPDLT